MPLRDVGGFHDWIERESPSRAAESVARTFIAELGGRPWTAPSVMMSELSSQPTYEVRRAALAVVGEPDVHVRYIHYYASDDVDLIALTSD